MQRANTVRVGRWNRVEGSHTIRVGSWDWVKGSHTIRVGGWDWVKRSDTIRIGMGNNSSVEGRDGQEGDDSEFSKHGNGDDDNEICE